MKMVANARFHLFLLISFFITLSVSFKTRNLISIDNNNHHHDRLNSSGIRIYPMPKHVSFGWDVMVLDKSFSLSTTSNSSILLSAITRYQSLLFPEYDNNDQFVESNATNKLIIRVESNDETLQLGVDESYQLYVDNNTCQLNATTVYGAIRGLESFSQLILYSDNHNYYYIKSCPWIVDDEPRFPHRGTLLDTSRHFIPVPIIQDFLDALSYAKFNVFHWHIVDAQSFPMQSKVYPNLWKGAWSPTQVYTQRDIKQVIQYAKERGIRVIVEVDMPGHAYSWGVGYPNVLPSNYSESQLCNQPCPEICNVPLDPSSQDSYDIAFGLISELSTLFPDNYIHVGGDEVLTACWENSKQIQQWMFYHGFFDWSQAIEYFETQVHDKVLQVGKYPIVWEDTFLSFGKKLNKNVTVQVYHQLSILQSAIKEGYYGIASNVWNWYLDLSTPWEAFYTNDISANLTKPEELSRLLGGETCIWGELMDPSNLFSKVWPRNAAAAERLWSPAQFNNTIEVEPRLERFRCHMIFRGVESAPLNSTSPNNPGSCYDE